MIDILFNDWIQGDDQTFQVRNPLNGAWVAVEDARRENDNDEFPVIGHCSYAEAEEHWVDTGKLKLNPATGIEEPVMAKEPRENPIVWEEDVRLLAYVQEAPPEGGTLEVGVHEAVGTQDVGPGGSGA